MYVHTRVCAHPDSHTYNLSNTNQLPVRQKEADKGTERKKEKAISTDVHDSSVIMS